MWSGNEQDESPESFLAPDSVVAVVDQCRCVADFGDDRDEPCDCDGEDCEHYCRDHDLYHCPYAHDPRRRNYHFDPEVTDFVSPNDELGYDYGDHDDLGDEYDGNDILIIIICAHDPRWWDPAYTAVYAVLLAEQQRDREDAERRRRGDASASALWREVPGALGSDGGTGVRRG